jgi:16S rRNA (guanine(966)-N(2))-methyltransferase RsmD
MRITAGRFKGMRLPSLRGKTVRPTTERVREAVFNILGPVVEGAHILELFAGSGAFGFEALSRGAASVVFVDKDKKVAATIAETASMLGLQDSSSILVMDASRAMEKLARANERFSIIYLDPPYDTGWIARIMNAPALITLFTADGVLLVEKGIHTPDSPLPDAFRKRLVRQYGDTLIEILDLAGAPAKEDL